MIIEQAQPFLDEFFKNLSVTRIDVSSFFLDHVAYQASSSDDYEMQKAEILNHADYVSEEIIGDRRVGIFKLHTDIQYNDRQIPVIELIEQKKGQVCPSAYEHCEFVISESFDAFMSRYPNFSWDTSSAARPDFPHLKLKLNETMQVKFHPQDILDVVAAQQSK